MQYEPTQSNNQEGRSPLGTMSAIPQPISGTEPALAANSRIPVPKRLIHGQPTVALPQPRTPSVFGAQNATPTAEPTNSHTRSRKAVKHADVASAAPAMRMAGRYKLGVAPRTSRRHNDENMMAQSTAPRPQTEIPNVRHPISILQKKRNHFKPDAICGNIYGNCR
jgi:hypothetical protein